MDPLKYPHYAAWVSAWDTSRQIYFVVAMAALTFTAILMYAGAGKSEWQLIRGARWPQVARWLILVAFYGGLIILWIAQLAS